MVLETSGIFTVLETSGIFTVLETSLDGFSRCWRLLEIFRVLETSSGDFQSAGDFFWKLLWRDFHDAGDFFWNF